MEDYQKPSRPEPRAPDVSRYFPANRRWPVRSDGRDEYGNFRPGNKSDTLPAHAGGYPYESTAPATAPACPPCVKHTEPIRLTDTPIRVTAGGSMTPLPLDAILLDLAGSRRAPVVTGLPGLRPLTVRISWADMSVPALSRDDWRVIADHLARPQRPVHVACLGGHGRTGTALAILLAIWGCIPPSDDPVAWVRAHYCDKAIETEVQTAYVRRMVRS